MQSTISRLIYDIWQKISIKFSNKIQIKINKDNGEYSQLLCVLNIDMTKIHNFGA